MTEVKISFTKNKFSHLPAEKLSPGARGLELEISTNFLVYDLAGSFERAVPPADSKVPFEKIAFIFADSNTENAFYQSLCDSNQKQFELSFDKEKVFLNVDGFVNEIDKTKPEVRVNFKNLLIFFESKLSGIIKLTAGSQGPTGPEIPPNVSQIRNNAITTIKQALNSEPKLTTSDLSSEYQNWETTINNSSDENQINSLKEKVLNNIKSKRTEREREREQKWQDCLLGNWRSIICSTDNYMVDLEWVQALRKQIKSRVKLN